MEKDFNPRRQHIVDFLADTDENHTKTLPMLIEYLKQYEMTPHRTTLYRDFFKLRQNNYDIRSERRGNDHVYYMGKRLFEKEEIFILADSVKGYKFMTEETCMNLINKLATLLPKTEASNLKYRVLIQGRIRNMEEGIFEQTSVIHQAIIKNRKIRFHYYQYNLDKQLVVKRDGAYYEVSPYEITLFDDNCYLIAFEGTTLKHYRIDKMKDAAVSDSVREAKDEYSKLDIQNYTRATFSMFSGYKANVSILADADIVGVFIDRFGIGIRIIKSSDEKSFMTKINAQVSDQFFGWIAALGGKAMITGPANVREEYEAFINRIISSQKSLEDRTKEFGMAAGD